MHKIPELEEKRDRLHTSMSLLHSMDSKLILKLVYHSLHLTGILGRGSSGYI